MNRPSPLNPDAEGFVPGRTLKTPIVISDLILEESRSSTCTDVEDRPPLTDGIVCSLRDQYIAELER